MSFTVLKLGWEFPPHNYGGLGVACEGLVYGLTQSGVQVILVLPRQHNNQIVGCRTIATDDGPLLKTRSIDSLLRPYITSQAYHEWLQQHGNRESAQLYGADMFAEIERYARIVGSIAEHESFDIIHAHDWMSFKAGVLAQHVSGKPLVVHVHATDFDRTGGNTVNQHVYDIERWGMHSANHIIAVSNFTKDKIIHHYGIEPQKVSVIHNAISFESVPDPDNPLVTKKGPIVLFLGRLTLQKGPDYFITAAHEILKHRPKTTFVIAGSGDMAPRLIEWVAREGMSDKILFTGQLERPDVKRAYQLADVFVMPSVSEPFGLTALEAMKNGTPVIISKQSGVSEVIDHVLKVDFWDINELVNKIIGVLDHDVLKKTMTDYAHQEVQQFSWQKVAQRCIDLYKTILSG